MQRLLFLCCLVLFPTSATLAQSPDATATDTGGEGVVHMRLAGPLNMGHAAQLKRALQRARAMEEPRLLLELDTPGGEVQLMWQLSKALDAASRDGVQIVCWIEGQAMSAGMILAISCDAIYMRYGSRIGAAMIIQFMPTGMRAVEGKIKSAFQADVRALAESRGRSPHIVMAMVDLDARAYLVAVDGIERVIGGREWDDARSAADAPDNLRTISKYGELLSLTGREALDLGFVEARAEDIGQVLEKMGSHGATLIEVPRTRSDGMLATLHEISWLLILAGVMLAFMEIKMPGFGIPGILSITCFATLFIGRYMVGLADVPHIVLAVLGVILIGVEIFIMPGTLWAGILGVLCLITSLVMAQVGPNFSFGGALDRQFLWQSMQSLAQTGLMCMFGAWGLSTVLPKTPLFRNLILQAPSPDDPAAPQGFADAMPETRDGHGQLALPGSLGRVVSALRPVGKVTLDANPAMEFEARSTGAVIEAGARVQIVAEEGGRIVVEEAASLESSGEQSA